MIASREQMTAEELLSLVLPGRRAELVRGRLVVREPAGWRHGGITARLATALSLHLELERRQSGSAHARGRVLTADPGFTIARNPDTVRAPDVAYVSRERWPGPLPDGFGELAPDLAVEVRSPNDRPGELLAKVGDWLTAGSALVWVIDPAREPAREAATVYRADGSVATLQFADALESEAVLPGFSLPLGELLAGDD